MNTYLQNMMMLFETVAHPAAGKMAIEKRKQRTSASIARPRATPDSLNIRDVYKNPHSFRRNPAP